MNEALSGISLFCHSHGLELKLGSLISSAQAIGVW